MNISTTETFRTRLMESEAAIPLNSDADVAAALGATPEEVGGLRGVLDQLKLAVPATTVTSFSSSDLRQVENTFFLEHALEPKRPNWAPVLQVIRFVLSAGAPLYESSNEAWGKILLLARAALVLGHEDGFQDPRMGNVANAARRLQARGYLMGVEDGRIQFADGELERATGQVLGYIHILGSDDFLRHLFGFLRQDRYAFDQYLLGRRHPTYEQVATPWLPVGFLLNLSVQVGRLGKPGLATPDRAWKEAIELAIDIVATLDLQDYGQWGLLSVEPEGLERVLSRLALGDHLFGLRQWPLRLAPDLLNAFFGSEGELLDPGTGWGLGDILPLISALASHASRPDPQILHRSVLLNALPFGKGEAILAALTHDAGVVNSDYRSPRAAGAEHARMMFKPFLAVDDQFISVPAMSLVGPATYEACMVAYRRAFGDDRANALLGDGCERVVSHFLDASGFTPSFERKRYKIGKTTLECDFILESDTHIIFIEAKAKSLTRSSMSGEPGAALFDFVRNILASQCQALRHERLLRSNGFIEFTNGQRLEHRGRDIIRVSVSLLEQASLQDKMLLWSLYGTLLRSSVTTPADHPQARTVFQINKILDTLRQEALCLQDLGIDFHAQRSGASLSAAQLAIYLEVAADLDDLADLLDARVNTMSLDPLFELNNYISSGLLEGARARRMKALDA